MIIQGKFKNVNNQVVEMIISNKVKDKLVINMDAMDDIFFADDPITISYDIENSFETNISRLCTIRLLTRTYLGDYLYANNEYDVLVNIFVDGKCIFAGFVEPNIYTQKYSDEFNELEINCTDFIATLQHNNMLNDKDYNLVVKGAKIKTYREFLDTIGITTAKLNLKNINYESQVWYDKSKETSKEKNIFDEAAVNELLFLGDDESDVYTNYDLLHELMQYLDLHICQVGYDFYIFSWDTVRNQTTDRFTEIKTGNEKIINFFNGTIRKGDYADTDTTISLDEVYNQIQITCDIEDIENVIESPLSTDTLKSPYNGKQLYMQEAGFGDKKNIYMDFLGKTNWDTYNFVQKYADKGVFNSKVEFIYDWYCRVMNNDNWTFKHKVDGVDKNIYEDLDLITADAASKQLCFQERMFKYLKEHSLTPALLSFGRTGNIIESGEKHQFEAQPNMKTSLVISINGNGKYKEGDEFPNEDYLANHAATCEFNNNKYVQLSPVDNTTKNYIVFSGEIFLQPRQVFSTYTVVDNNWRIYPVNLTDNKQLFYEQRYWNRVFPNSKTGYRTDTPLIRYMTPPTEMAQKLLEFNYSAAGDASDKIKKIPVLECQLKIGNKYLVEQFNEDGSSSFNWYDENSLPDATYQDTPNGPIEHYKLDTFTIGFDPTKGDFIIGQKYDITNTVTIDMNIGDAKGMAIPISVYDNVAGDLHFKILGPINTVWNQVTRRHRTWFRKTKWWTDAIPVLPNVENIYINDFECKIYTNNANLSNEGEGDLIYMSDEMHKFVNKKDDITFKINTGLTPDEAAKCGVKSVINLSNVYTKDNEGNFKALREINDNAKSIIYAKDTYKGKPEELYIESYYNEYKAPRTIFECTLFDKTKDISKFLPFYTFLLNQNHKYYNLMGAATSLKYGTAEVKLKNCEF